MATTTKGRPIKNRPAADAPRRKRCTECGLVKGGTAFYYTASGRPRGKCIECTKADAKARKARTVAAPTRRSWRSMNGPGIDVPETLFCPKCDQEKPRDAFYYKADGKPQAGCKDCRRFYEASGKQFWPNDPEAPALDEATPKLERLLAEPTVFDPPILQQMNGAATRAAGRLVQEHLANYLRLLAEEIDKEKTDAHV